MRTRLSLLAVLMLMAACRLSDRQQVGVLKFAATTITSATTQSNAAPVAIPSVGKAKPVKVCAQQHRLHMRVRRIMTRVMRFEVIAAERTCPKARTSAVRS